MTSLPTELSTDSKSLVDRAISCARIALDVPMRTLFDYVIPEGTEITVGDRVTVPFGSKQRIGVVVERKEPGELPARKLRPISAVRKDAPPLPASWLRKSFINSLTVSLVGRNLIYFYGDKRFKDVDLDQYNYSTGASGLQSPTTRRYGFNVNVVF